MNKLNVGCGPFYADGWVNTDVFQSENITPDVLVKSGEPYPFDDSSFDVIYLGHILEHISWNDVPSFLNEISRIATPDAQIMVVGPDIFKVLNMWKTDELDIKDVMITLEHQDKNFQYEKYDVMWDGAPHYWNCHEDRIIDLLNNMGFKDVYNQYDFLILTEDDVCGVTWPIVARVRWQMAVSFKNKK